MRAFQSNTNYSREALKSAGEAMRTLFSYNLQAIQWSGPALISGMAAVLGPSRKTLPISRLLRISLRIPLHSIACNLPFR